MRTALIPVQSHNPDVTEQAPGYAIYDPARDVFACELEDGVSDLGANYLQGYQLGWCGPRGKVRVWASLASASTVAIQMRCVVSTIPRFNGHGMVWGTDWSKV